MILCQSLPRLGLSLGMKWGLLARSEAEQAWNATWFLIKDTLRVTSNQWLLRKEESVFTKEMAPDRLSKWSTINTPRTILNGLRRLCVYIYMHMCMIQIWGECETIERGRGSNGNGKNTVLMYETLKNSKHCLLRRAHGRGTGRKWAGRIEVTSVTYQSMAMETQLGW